MHNLHFMIVQANDPKDACNIVETEIQDWGNDNNWRTIAGCVSEDDEVYNTPESSRFKPSEMGYDTIRKINEVI